MFGESISEEELGNTFEQCDRSTKLCMRVAIGWDVPLMLLR